MTQRESRILTNVVIFAIKYLMKILKALGIAIACYAVFIFCYAIILAALAQDNNSDSSSADQTVAQIPPTEVDPQLEPLVKVLGIDPTGLHIAYVDNLPPNESGFFDGKRTISILRGGERNGPQPNIERILAHEYMHSIWNKHTEGERDMLSSNLEALYNSDPQMQERMKSYINDFNLAPGSPQFSNELHSVYCTEVSDQYLSSPVANECNKWIKRSTLTLVR